MRFRKYIFLVLSVILFISLIFSCFHSAEKKVETRSLKLRSFGTYSKNFNDLNEKHLNSADDLGISPIASREAAKKIGRKLKEVESNKYYKVDDLTHSIPFLVPQAKDLLTTIGKNFQDSLKSKRGGQYKVIVTSILRTEHDIKRLRQRNGNASLHSAHRFGTTFDITYARFEQIDQSIQISVPQLKHVLAEVLIDLRKEKKCYVKYEVQQGCFHITAR